MLEILQEAALGSYLSMKKLAIIVIPLMMVMEIFKAAGLFDRIAEFFAPVVRVYGMKKESGFPLVIGIIIGLSYGAGIIFQSAKRDNLPQKDLHLLTYFLVACHAVIEDTAVFVAMGASGFLLLTVRLVVAAVFTFVASKLMTSSEEIPLDNCEVESIGEM